MIEVLEGRVESPPRVAARGLLQPCSCGGVQRRRRRPQEAQQGLGALSTALAHVGSDFPALGAARFRAVTENV